MKLGKLKKRSIKELETLRSEIYKLENRMTKRFSKMTEALDTAIHHIGSLKVKKLKKVKPIKLETPKLPTSFEKEQKRKSKKG